MAIIIWPVKDPDEVLDYSINWIPRLAEGDTIDTSVWTGPTPLGIIVDSEAQTDDSTTLWLSGGTLGVTYEFLNRVVTADGRTMDQTTRLKIKSK